MLKLLTLCSGINTRVKNSLCSSFSGSKAVDDGAENLQQFSNAIEALCLVDELEEDVVDASSDERSEIEEFAVDPVKSCLEEIALSRIFRIKQFQ